MPLLRLDQETTARILSEGGLLIDLRPVADYLERHWLGSIPLLWEDGPGMGSRARDLLPLDCRLVILDSDALDLDEAAASFRGKGFDVAGSAPGVDGRRPAPSNRTVTTEQIAVEAAEGLILLDVNDPGTRKQPRSEFIPAELLWGKASELKTSLRIGVLAGWGVRAATAVGILEKLGFGSPVFVRTRPAGAKPPMAGPEVFRVG